MKTGTEAIKPAGARQQSSRLVAAIADAERTVIDSLPRVMIVRWRDAQDQKFIALTLLSTEKGVEPRRPRSGCAITPRSSDS